MSIFHIYALFYVFCMCLIAFPIALILLVFGVFFRDMQSALGIVLQIIMEFTNILEPANGAKDNGLFYGIQPNVLSNNWSEACDFCDSATFFRGDV